VVLIDDDSHMLNANMMAELVGHYHDPDTFNLIIVFRDPGELWLTSFPTVLCLKLFQKDMVSVMVNAKVGQVKTKLQTSFTERCV